MRKRPKTRRKPIKKSRPAHKITVLRDKRGLGIKFAALSIKKAVSAALDARGIASPCEISVLLTDDGGVRALNAQFRGIDKATDVLSFPSGDFSPDEGKMFLGDMALSLPMCRKQAKEYGHPVKRELMYLTVHSVLHLLGFDHVDEGEQKKLMRGIEKEIMNTLGVSI
jgi:probable rRNA maturation factor